jgi:multiple sugar transport system ATP-binding protein
VASISLGRIDKVYAAGAAAVRDVSLEIADGELLVLLGPSGSGKSTLLRIIAGLEAPTSGRIVMNGADVTDSPPQSRDVAMVFQSYALYPHKTGRENLMFGLQMRRVPAADIAARVQRVAGSLGLVPLLDRRPAQLSGGERQRVALGRAVVREPRAFLLDEPLSNLDPRLRVSTRTELALLHRRLGTTMVYVTHDQEEAMTLGTRVAVMRDGALEQVGPPMEIFRRPSNTFVAEFVGTPSMNLLSCECAREGHEWVVSCGGTTLPVEADARLESADRIVLGVRPHDVSVVAPNDGHLSGRVEVRQSLGSAMVLHVRPEMMPDVLMRVLVSGDETVGEGQAIGLRVRTDRLHYFSATDGQRLD